jgi:hypothetical protein
MNIYLIASEDYKVFGVGQTTRSYEERHKDGDWAKFHNYLKMRGEKLLLIGWWEDTDVVDHDIHRYLKTLPHIKKSAEWFSHESTLDIIKNQIEEKFFSSTPEKKENLQLQKHQKEFVAKAQADYLEFLLFAKCRSGKSVMTLSHIVDKGHKVTLVVSRYTSPMQSWKEDSDKFANFNNLKFINVNDNDYLQQIEYWMDTEKQIILWACVQSRKILDLPVDIDLLVYDEAHVGYNSAQWNNLRKVVTCPVLYVTGTAYKMVWDFNDSQRYIYSYYEEQLDKKNGLNNRPSMRVILANYDSSQYQAIFGDDPDAMKNLFNVDDNGDFIHPELVQDFVTNRFATQRVLRPQNRLLKDSTHLYITLPSVAACYAFAEYMEGTRFAPLVATGDSGNDSDDINKHIAENPNGSCILTRTANVLGVTAKEVDTIVNCAEGSSIEFWTQFAFRGGSSDRDWQVIDFCPQRCLESLRQTYVAACDTSPEVAEYDFTDFVSITEWCEEFTELTPDQVNEILAADVGNAIRLVSGLATTLDFDKLRDLDFNLNLQPSGSNVAKTVELNNNNANGKTNKKRQGELTKSEKDEIYDKIDTIQSILERIPLVLFHAINSKEVMNNVDSVINSDHYQPVTMDDEKILEKALEYGVANRESLSKRISSAYVDIKHAINNDKRMTLAKLSESTQSQQDIPLELLDQMLAV